MAQLVEVPSERLCAQTLDNLLEEFASRDGTDYGVRETPLPERVAQLRGALRRGELRLLFDADSEHWDLLDARRARELLAGESADGQGAA